MDFLGIGPLELIFIILIAIIIFGPNDIIKASRTAGKYLRKLVQSDGWRTVQQASKEIRTLPNKLMREAGIEELEKDIGSIRDSTKVEGFDRKDISSWITPPTEDVPPLEKPKDEATIPNTEE